MTYTTLNKILESLPCKDGWEKLLKHLGKTQADDEPLSFSTILESNGVNNAIWCLRTLGEKYDSKIRLLAADIAERVLHIYEEKYSDDCRPRSAIKAARDYANGMITERDLRMASAAASSAAYTYDAYAADAPTAAAAAARTASSAYAAAAAARTARYAAYAAVDAAYDAAAYAAGAYAADAYDAAAYAAGAGAAARATEEKAQKEILLKYFGEEE